MQPLPTEVLSRPARGGLTLQRWPVEVLVRQDGLASRLLEMVSDSYVDPSAAMDYALSRNTRAFLLVEGPHVRSFMLTAPETLLGRPAVYAGLAATDRTLRSKGYFRLLLESFVEYVRSYQEVAGARALVYARTAHPSAYRALCSVFEVDPKPDGSYSRESGELARAVRGVHYGAGSEGHPFVLRGSAGYFYSELERARIAGVQAEGETDIVRVLEIDETCGDRILLLMRVPEPRGDHV